MTTPVLRAHLVCGGEFHDFDFARARLLDLLAEHEHVRTTVSTTFADIDAIAAAEVLITYTCNVRPTRAEQAVLSTFVAEGGHWLALHATNASLDPLADGTYATPDATPLMSRVLGSRFLAHPRMEPFEVRPSEGSEWFTAGIGQFTVEDELYLCEYYDEDRIIPLLETRFVGQAPSFEAADWPDDDVRLVAYLRPYGEGEVVYLTLGHCRGHYDMQPLMAWYPHVQREAWETPEVTELLRRGVRWAIGEDVMADA